jgi:hypothetical protein
MDCAPEVIKLTYRARPSRLDAMGLGAEPKFDALQNDIRLIANR